MSWGDAREPSGPEARWLVTVVHTGGSSAGARLALAAGDEVALGRASTAFGAGAFDDNGVSREHTRLRVSALDELTIADDGSRNGTYVNGARVDRATLRDGDVLSVGDAMLLVERGVAGDEAIAGSPAMSRTRDAIDKLAASAAPVLLCGETGTGKDELARAVHRASGRTGAFVPIRCGALAADAVAAELFGRAAGELGADDPGRPGLLETADGGSVYLDGVDDAGADLQTSLLAFIDTGEVRRVGAQRATTVDARVIASTRAEPSAFSQRPGLRRAFARRLERLVVSVPPLRQRRADILPLAAAMVRQFAGTDRPLHRKLRLALLRHSFPGNVRELAALVEALVVEHADDGPLHLTDDARDRLRTGNPLTSRDSHISARARRLVIAADGKWCELDGEAIDLARRHTLRRLVAALARRRSDGPEQPLTLDDLLAAGWPGEIVLPEAGRNRVHVALTTLRKLGLRDVIIREDDGYMLDPSVELEIR